MTHFNVENNGKFIISKTTTTTTSGSKVQTTSKNFKTGSEVYFFLVFIWWMSLMLKKFVWMNVWEHWNQLNLDWKNLSGIGSDWLKVVEIETKILHERIDLSFIIYNGRWSLICLCLIPTSTRRVRRVKEKHDNGRDGWRTNSSVKLEVFWLLINS